MDIKEAKNFFKRLPNKVLFKCLSDDFVSNYDNAYSVVAKALEKQEPCKVEEGTEGGFDWYCKCGTYLSPTKCKEIKYCISCGQKLDWD